MGVSRGWVWPVLLAVGAGVVLLTHAARRFLASLPDDTRAAYGEAWRRNRRPIVTTGVVLTWTMAYALYSISLPLLGDVERLVAPGPAPGTPAVSAPIEPGSPPVALPPGTAGPVVDLQPAPEAPTSSPAPTDPAGPTTPMDCSAAAVSEAVRQVQAGAELLLGRPLGADVGLVIEAVAGCGGDPANAALALLSPVYELLTDLGIPMLALPPLPAVEVPRLPGAVAAPFRSTVFPVCAGVTAQLVTVSAVAPVARLSPDDVFRVLQSVMAVCSAFAPEPGS